MAVNDKIRTPDYNDIQSALATVMAGGSGNYGWGQTMLSSQVSTSTKVTINEWANLRYDIINAYKHIYGSTPTMVSPAEGNTVRYSGSFVPDTGASDAPVTQYQTYVTNISANRFTVGAGQYATTAATTSSTTWPSAFYGSYWTTRIACLVTVQFSSATEARYFFNSGGTIRFTASQSGGTVSSQNSSWASILTTAGTREFGANTPSTGTTPADGLNWYRLTNTWTQWYSISGSSPYGSNTFKIYSRCPVVNNSTGLAQSAEFLLEFNDVYTDPGNYYLDSPNTIDKVDGTFSVSASTKYATGVLVPTGVGNFVVSNPVVTVGAVAP